MPAAADARWRQEQTSEQGHPESRAQHHRCPRTRVVGNGRLGTGRQDDGRDSMHGTKNDRCWSGANSSANATLAIPMTVCRAGAAKSEVSLYTCISKPAGKATDKFIMPVLCFNVISDESPAGNLSACPEFLTVPTRASSVAEDMIIETEVHHLLKSGHQKDVRRDVSKCAVQQ